MRILMEIGRNICYHAAEEFIMATVEKRSVSLSPELASVVDAAVSSGEYGSASEIVREALRLWKERRDLLGYTVEELQVLWKEGMNSGSAKPFDNAALDAIKAAGRKRLEAQKDARA
jgi:antitoxin ParD1/3/4